MARAASPCNGPKEVVGMKKQITNNQTRMRLPMMVKAFFCLYKFAYDNEKNFFIRITAQIC